MTSTANRASRTILCPTDFSVASTRALLHAAGLCGSDELLIVLHIDTALPSERKARLREHLHHFSAYSGLLSSYECSVRFAVEHGTPSAEIIAYAEQANADLIVIGSHGAQALGRLLVGSTAEALMRQATRPVLLLKSPEQSDEATKREREPLLSKTNA